MTLTSRTGTARFHELGDVGDEPQDSFCCLTWPSTQNGRYPDPLRWINSGDNPHSGDPGFPNGTPTRGLLAKRSAADPAPFVVAHLGVEVLGDGPVDASMYASFNSVVGAGTSTARFQLRLNGSVVVETIRSITIGGLFPWMVSEGCSVLGLEVVHGDFLDATIIADHPLVLGPVVPAGTGARDNRMIVSGFLTPPGLVPRQPPMRLHGAVGRTL